MDNTDQGNKSEDEPESPEEEEVDPRIQGELEKLNQSTDDINRWETELEDSRQRFRAILVEATVKLDEQVKKIGKAVEESKPYWEARRVARQAQVEAQRATQEFQRAIEILRAAKETIALAEERLLEEDSRQFDSAWQEMLNHATQRAKEHHRFHSSAECLSNKLKQRMSHRLVELQVMDAEQSRTRSELEHRETAAHYNAATSHMRQLEKKLKRSISKSRPYFDLKSKYYLQLEQLKRKVDEFQAKLSQAKAEYRTALRNLEAISDEIHARRRLAAIGPRSCGVGAEKDLGAGDDISNFKMESDGISMISETFEEENCNGSASDEDAETQSRCSSSSGSYLPSCSSPYPLLSSSCPFPSCISSPSFSPCPRGVERPSPGSLEGFGSVSPVLGARSECSGASSPECEQERGERAEGAERKRENTTQASSQKSTTVEKGVRRLSLQRTEDSETDAAVAGFSPAVPLLLINSV